MQRQWPGFKVVLVGYLFGSLTIPLTVVVVLMLGMAPDRWDLGGTLGLAGGYFVLVFLAALPGFLILRWLLYVLGRTGWVSFAIAGGLNGALTEFVFVTMVEWFNNVSGAYSPTLFVVLLGVWAGIVAWFTEQWFTDSRRTGGR